jgi:hypothetical protein
MLETGVSHNKQTAQGDQNNSAVEFAYAFLSRDGVEIHVNVGP